MMSDEFDDNDAQAVITAYWQAYPNLTPVAVGDRLAITDAFEEDREIYGGMDAWVACEWIAVCSVSLGEADIEIGLHGYIMENGAVVHEVSVARVDVEIVGEMRRAYLRSQTT